MIVNNYYIYKIIYIIEVKIIITLTDWLVIDQ